MGFYDVRCLVTGLVPTGDATAVVLRRTTGGYEPVTTGITGTYDGYGSIHGIDPDPATELVLESFAGWMRSGRFVVDGDALGIGPEPPRDIEDLLWLIERSSLALGPDPEFDHPIVTLDGDLVTMALIAQPVWDALIAAPPAAEVPELLAEPHRQLAVIAGFLAARGQAWAPPGDPAQRYPTELGMQYGPDEQRDCLAEARRDLGDVEILRRVFDEYEAALVKEAPGDAERSTTDQLAEMTALLEELSTLEVRTATVIDVPDPPGP